MPGKSRRDPCPTLGRVHLWRRLGFSQNAWGSHHCDCYGGMIVVTNPLDSWNWVQLVTHVTHVTHASCIHKVAYHYPYLAGECFLYLKVNLIFM